jgi:predicted phage terminase large subunit-like protein
MSLVLQNSLNKIEEDIARMSRDELLAFILFIRQGYKVNWHHRELCSRLSLLKHQKRQRIMIFLPPQTGKSEIVSRSLPAWLLGNDPCLRIILSSYSAELATSFNRDSQKIMLGEEYKKIFPQTSLNSKRTVTGHQYKRTSNYFETVGMGGYLYSVGVGGSTTGKAADVFIIDDPFKDLKQAYSVTTRAGVVDWYNSVAQTRLSIDGHIIIMHTRWHKNDLAGYLLESASENTSMTQWEVISIPATGLPDSPLRYENDKRQYGEPLWPEFKGDVDYLNTVRASVGEKVWTALYQQNPTVEGGNIIKEDWIKLYTELPFKIKDMTSYKTVQSWDLQFKETGSSYTCGVVIYKHNASYYLMDIYRKRADIVETKRAIKEMADNWPKPSSILIEDKANGPAVMSLLKKEISGMIPVRPTASKDERLHVVAPLFEAGNFFIPANHPLTGVIINELTNFPVSQNDDIVDAISQGLQHFSKLTGMRHLEAMTRL